MGDILECFLDAEAARIGKTPGAVAIRILPRRKAAVRQAAHAIGLILADGGAFGRGHEHQCVVRGFQRFGKARAMPFARVQQIAAGDEKAFAADADIQRKLVIAGGRSGKGDLPLAARFQRAQVRIADGRRIETGRRKFVQQDVAFVQMQQALFPRLRNRAFLSQQRPRAELEHDLAQFGIVEPVGPFVQPPHAAGHHDRHRFGHAEFPHGGAQLGNARVWILGCERIFGVGQAVVATGQPRVFIHHRAQPFGGLGIGALPQRAERPGRADDRVIMHAILRGDFGEFVGHAGPAGHAVHHAARAFQHAMQDALGTAHFPQHIDVDGADAALQFRGGDLIGALHLGDPAIDAVLHQFFMTIAAGGGAVDLRDDVAIGVIAVGVDRAHRANPAGQCPGARRGVVGGRNTLAAFHQRPHLAATHHQRFHTRKHLFPFCHGRTHPPATALLRQRCGSVQAVLLSQVVIGSLVLA